MNRINKIKFLVVLVLLICAGLQLKSQNKGFHTDDFLYGASVYPEIMDRAEQIKMLNLFVEADFTVLRLGESAWGNLEPKPGEYDFKWLRFFLDEMHRRGLKAILGTCSYVPPLWLTMNHQEVLMQYADGSSANPMGRHAISRNHPIFRKALERFLLAYATEFKDHPAVIGWQLDNEIEQEVGRIDYNPENRKQWLIWLEKEYGTVEELNNRLGLKAWGLKVNSFQEVPLPSKSNDGDLPALKLACLKYDRDNIISYFEWQKSLLRQAGVTQWITSNWIMTNQTIADDSAWFEILDISSINQYQPTEDNNSYWAWQAWFNDLHRSTNQRNNFLVTETRIGPTGNERLWTPAASEEQFFTWMLQPVAFGAQGIIHWTGNRYHGGHWPHWGGILDWSGKPEPDYYWTKKIATFFKKWNSQIVRTSVDATAAVVSDFSQRAMLKSFPHTPIGTPEDILFESTEAFHRMGLGIDVITTESISENLYDKYKTLVLAALPSFEGEKVQTNLLRFVSDGGMLVITPFCGYQTTDGIFRNNGFAADLKKLTGNSVRTIRLLANSEIKEQNHVKWLDKEYPTDDFIIGMDGFTEILEVDNQEEIIARFATTDQVMNQKPAATMKKIGKGRVVKLAFWTGSENFTKLMNHIIGINYSPLKNVLQEGVQSVPRSDGSLFIINTTGKTSIIHLKESMKDRISGHLIQNKYDMKAYQTLWLELINK